MIRGARAKPEGQRSLMDAPLHPNGLGALATFEENQMDGVKELLQKISSEIERREWEKLHTGGCVPTDTLGAPVLTQTTLPRDSKERKQFPLYSGPLKYFPAALAGVARICKVGNDKHNGLGTPLHHARWLSMDHEDCIVRHLVDMLEDHGAGVGRDENGLPQVDYIAWRALALAQRWHEENDSAPLAPGAVVRGQPSALVE